MLGMPPLNIATNSSAYSGADGNTFGGFTKITGITTNQIMIIAVAVILAIILLKRL